MSLSVPLLRDIQAASPSEAWRLILEEAWRICSEPLEEKHAVSQVTKRDQAVASLDLVLATAAWDLWVECPNVVPKTSDVLASWWESQSPGRAVLILDALSLREVPWLIQGAESRGYVIQQGRATCAEIPPDTQHFAEALGFAQRSALENNGAGGRHRLPGARTDCVDLPWEDCAELVGSHLDFVLWHQWPDHLLHDYSDQTKGLEPFLSEIVEHLTSEPFWKLIDRLATGRRVVITSDHGYAASGGFPDTQGENQTKHLKEIFGSRRFIKDQGGASPWVPPIDLALTTAHGTNRFVVGRRKWKSPGGYPTLAHGGLSILEVAVPWIELGR